MAPLALSAQRPVVLLTEAADLRASVAQVPALRAAGMDVAVVAAAGTFIGVVKDPARDAFQRLGKPITARTDDRVLARLPAHQRIGPLYLNALLEGRFDGPGAHAPMDWAGHPEGEHGHADALHRPDGPRGGFPDKLDWTCTQSYNSERMLGTVVASTFFLESNGAIDADLYTWTPTAIAATKLQVIDAWTIWSRTATLHGRNVTAIMDWYEPSGGIPVQGYEPVTHASTQDQLWIGAVMQNLGRTEPSTLLRMDGFNHDRRMQLGADQAFCGFIAYNPTAQGAPNQFTDGKVGYAYLGGPYLQILYKANGWSTEQLNRVYGHELAHIFHAFDEYTASGIANCSRSFNGRQNLNFQGPPCSGGAMCVMVDNSFAGVGSDRRWNLCAHTPYHLGWTGGLTPPVCLSPVADVVLPSGMVTLKWDRSGAPALATGQVKVIDRVTEAVVICESVGQNDSLVVSLTNGQYRWTIAEGATNDANGYAGTFGTPALFRVAAPLSPAFSVQPGGICAGGSVTVTDATTGGPVSWSWSFPGGTPASFEGQQPPAIAYALPGSYAITLTAGDGMNMQSTTLVNAVEVLGGAALPFTEAFDSGVFPPNGWEAPSAQPTPIAWTADATSGCALQTSALVNAHAFSGEHVLVELRTPRIDLTTAVMPYLRFLYAYAQGSAANTETLVISGHDCTYAVSEELFERGGAELATNGGAFVSGAWQPSSCAEWREVVVPLDALAGRVAELSFGLITAGGQNLFLDDVRIFDGMRVHARAMLQGPYDAIAGLMRDDLRTQAMIPQQEPYSAAGHVFHGGGGGERLEVTATGAVGADAVVDWVVVEARDASAPATVVASRAALVQRDGDLVDIDGVRPVGLPVPPGSYYFAVRHRNHLGAMTATPVPLSNTMSLLDLGDPLTAAWGTDARKLSGGRALLWCGDANGNGDLKYTGADNDRDVILQRLPSGVVTAVIPGYWREDVNLDGLVKYTGANNDRDPILSNLNGQVTGVRIAQLP